MSVKKYSPEYFINKFENIPDYQWCIGMTKDPFGRHCALGHCGYNYTNSHKRTTEADKLSKLLRNLAYITFDYNFDTISDPYSPVIKINDNLKCTLGDTPKERIINALVMVACGLDKEL